MNATMQSFKLVNHERIENHTKHSFKLVEATSDGLMQIKQQKIQF